MITVREERQQHLSDEELVIKYQSATNQTMKDQIAEILLSRVEKIISWVAAKYANIPNTDREDRMSELYFTFYKALNQYSPTKGMKFSSFCRQMFESDMLNLYQYKKRKKRYTGDREVSLENSGVGFTVTVNLEDFSDIEFASFLRQIGLTEREMTVCSYFITGGTKKSELARNLHVSSPMISKYLKNIGKKLHTNSARSSQAK